MDDILFLKMAIIVLFVIICFLLCAVNTLWKRVEHVHKCSKFDFSWLQHENTHRELEMRVLCTMLGVNYDREILGYNYGLSRDKHKK